MARSTPLERSTVVALAAMAMAVFVVANDVTALSVALPNIESDFDVDVGTAQWVISAYALIFGVLIVTGGRLADLLGRRRIFFAGAAVFAFFSLLGGLAPEAWVLIACRALMGIGGALMWPATLGMTYSILPKDRAALGGALIIGSAGFGNAAGPLIGGFLTDAFSWRWILFLNVPIAILACLVTWRAVPESRGDEHVRGFDYVGVATLTTGLVALLVALDEADSTGWGSPLILGLLGLFVLMMAAFVVNERRAGARALVPRDVISNRPFAAACLAVLLMSPTFFVALVYLPEFMQQTLGYSPVKAGLGLLPMMGVFALVSFASAPLYERLGPRPVLAAGAACLVAGPLLLALVEAGDSWAQLIPGMVLLGAGVGLFYSSVTTAAVTALDPSRASLAGGIVYMFQVAGGSVGLGIATTVFTAEAGDGVSSRIERVVRASFESGFQAAFLLVGVLAFAGFLVTVLLVGRPRKAATAA